MLSDWIRFTVLRSSVFSQCYGNGHLVFILSLTNNLPVNIVVYKEAICAEIIH